MPRAIHEPSMSNAICQCAYYSEKLHLKVTMILLLKKNEVLLCHQTECGLKGQYGNGIMKKSFAAFWQIFLAPITVERPCCREWKMKFFILIIRWKNFFSSLRTKFHYVSTNSGRCIYISLFFFLKKKIKLACRYILTTIKWLCYGMVKFTVYVFFREKYQQRFFRVKVTNFTLAITPSIYDMVVILLKTNPKSRFDAMFCCYKKYKNEKKKPLQKAQNGSKLQQSQHRTIFSYSFCWSNLFIDKLSYNKIIASLFIRTSHGMNFIKL